jgi:hypothetical protein
MIARSYVPGEIARHQTEMVSQAGLDPVAWFALAVNLLGTDSHVLYCFALARLRRLGWELLYRPPRGRAALDPRPIFVSMIEATASGNYAAARRLRIRLRDTGWTARPVEPRPGQEAPHGHE